MDARVDYVRIRMPFEVVAKVEAELTLNETARQICGRLGLNPSCYRTQSYFDSALHIWVAYWNIWGEASSLFYEEMDEGRFSSLMRLDYRYPLDAPNLDFKALYHMAEARNNKQSTVQYISSPIRQRREGRDGGGKGVIIGGNQSDRRVTIYERAFEGPHIEGQFQGRVLQKALHAANGSATHQEHGYAASVKQELRKQLELLLNKRMGVTIADLEQGLLAQEELHDYTDAEQVLQQLDLLWDILPDDAQQAFMDARNPVATHSHEDMLALSAMTRSEDWNETPDDFAGLFEVVHPHQTPS